MKSDTTVVMAQACLFERVAPVVMKTSYHDGVPLRPHVIVRVQDASGRIGYGEASPLPGFTGETAESILVQLRTHLLPLMIGLDAFHINRMHRKLAVLPGNGSAKTAIDIAFHDLAAKAADLPVTDLLGGACRDSIMTTFPIGICAPDEARKLAQDAMSRDMGAIKMKIGRDPAEDVVRIRAVRDEVGPDILLSVDANRGYTLPTFLQLAARLEAVGLDHAEQPLPAWDIDGLAHIRRHSGLRIMADESLNSLHDARRLIEAGAVDILAIKLIKTGGLAPARTIADLAAAYGVEISVISPFETQIGAAATLALALAVPNGAAFHGLRVFDTQPGMATTDITLREGRVYPSASAGLGVETLPELALADWGHV